MKNFCGVSPAVVTENDDPEDLGRVRVRLAGSEEEGSQIWARLATLVAGDRRGTWFIPEVEDEVLIAFEGGEDGNYYVIGSLWSDHNRPPETRNIGNRKKFLRLRSGLQITLNDVKGQESFVVETPGGQSLTLKDGPGTIEIRDDMNNVVTLETKGITIHSPTTVSISASSVEVNAGMINFRAPFARFDGTVMCDTLISNSVVSSSYTPGAGNLW